MAIGCGPFNLGLAALASTVPALDLVVLDARQDLRWHPGLMFDEAALQVNFLADLVSLIAPTHPLSFLEYLRHAERLYSFYVRECFHPTRREYEDYLRWTVSRLPSVRFSHRVERVNWDETEQRFAVIAVRANGERVVLLAKDLVIGIGTEPALSHSLARLADDRCMHAADYLVRQDRVGSARHVTVVGSGQTGAEVILHLLRRTGSERMALSWITRTPSFAPLDYTKLVLEMTTPAYVRYFYDLPQATKDRLIVEQWRHYKGISTRTLEQIHDVLYQRELELDPPAVELRCGTAVESASSEPSGRVHLQCLHADTGRAFTHATDLVIAATGYRQRRPAFLEPIEDLVRRDVHGRYGIRRDHSLELDPSIPGRIFVSHADLHSHGVAAPDLGIGAYRNATILNAITGREVYRLPARSAFTRFEAPEAAPAAGPGSTSRGTVTPPGAARETRSADGWRARSAT